MMRVRRNWMPEVKDWDKLVAENNTDARFGYDPVNDVCVGVDRVEPLVPLTPRGELEQSARDQFSHGHPEFTKISIDELELHSRKNNDYARGGDPLGNFDRVASILANYPGLSLGDRKTIALTYALKQLDAALYMLANGYNGAVEGVYARLGDVSIYAKLVQCMLRDEEKENG
jgi:hypothetical protein